MVKNYIAKIALISLLRYAEINRKGFDSAAFLSSLGEAELSSYELFDKYSINDLDKLISGLQGDVPDEEAFFIRLGLDGIASKIGSYSFFLQNSENFRDLLNKFSQYSHIITDIISSIELVELKDQLKVTYRFSRDTLKLSNRSLASILEVSYSSFAALYKDMAFSLDQKMTFNSSFAHIISDQLISELLGHNFISNSQDNSILIPKEVLEINNPRFEANLPDTVIQGLSKHVDAHNEASLISIISNLLDNKPSLSLEDISDQLHISKRTLQRRLKDQDINFTSLKQNAANLRSIELLDSNKHTIEEIATILGYSSTATFIHAFTNWQGMSPNTYLKQR